LEFQNPNFNGPTVGPVPNFGTNKIGAHPQKSGGRCSGTMKSRTRMIILLVAWMLCVILIVLQNEYMQVQYRSLYLLEDAVAVIALPSDDDDDDAVNEPSLPVHGEMDGLAACLLVMDDNHFLVEWLAYHYFVGPLRSLVVAVDPRSRTSPASILDRYHDSELCIVQWHDADFMNVQSVEYKMAVQRVVAQFGKRRLTPDLVRHRVRQRLFYDACLRHHLHSGASYTLLTDTDEFLLVNYETVRASRLYTPRTISEPGSVWHALQHERAQYPKDANTQSPCVQIPRIRFGATETTQNALDWQHSLGSLPTNEAALLFNTSHLATYRWQTHALDHDRHVNKLSKAMVDVSRLDDNFPQVTSIHRPIKPYCPTSKLHIPPSQQVRTISK
jgi:hypothetical protein